MLVRTVNDTRAINNRVERFGEVLFSVVNIKRQNRAFPDIVFVSTAAEQLAAHERAYVFNVTLLGFARAYELAVRLIRNRSFR